MTHNTTTITLCTECAHTATVCGASHSADITQITAHMSAGRSWDPETERTVDCLWAVDRLLSARTGGCDPHDYQGYDGTDLILLAIVLPIPSVHCDACSKLASYGPQLGPAFVFTVQKQAEGYWALVDE